MKYKIKDPYLVKILLEAMGIDISREIFNIELCSLLNYFLWRRSKQGYAFWSRICSIHWDYKDKFYDNSPAHQCIDEYIKDLYLKQK